MTETSPVYHAVGPTARSGWVALAITLAATAAAMLIDRTVFELFNAPRVYDKDLGRLLRVLGFMGTWLVLAWAVSLQHDGAGPTKHIAVRRAWMLFWSPLLAGALAEVMKILVRRERPAIHDGAYGFRPWDERTWSGAGLAFPSSHAAVAFGGAFMLARIFPRSKWVGIALAVGCGVTRVAARAHFVSDVVFAAGIGWLVSWFLWRKWRPTATLAAVLVLGTMVASPTSLAAQTLRQPIATLRTDVVPQAPACTEYRDCALGLMPSFGGITVVRGEREEPLQTLGFFVPGGSLNAVFVGDTLAQRFGRAALRERRIGAILTVTAVVTGAFIGTIDGQDYGAATGIVLAATAQAFTAAYFQLKADASLSRAVWAFNRRFAARPEE